MFLGRDFIMFLRRDFTMFVRRDFIMFLKRDFTMFLRRDFIMFLGRDFIMFLRRDFIMFLRRDFIIKDLPSLLILIYADQILKDSLYRVVVGVISVYIIYSAKSNKETSQNLRKPQPVFSSLYLRDSSVNECV